MDPFHNNLRSYNVGNLTDPPEEKVSSDASESPQINDNTRMTAQYLLQQQLIQQMQDEASRQQQIAQLVQRQQQERQVQNFPERIPEDIRRLLISGQYNTIPSNALLQLQLQTQLELQQQQQLQLQQRELGHIENQLLIQQQIQRDQRLHLQQQQIDPSTILPRQTVLRQLASLNPNDYADLISSYSLSDTMRARTSHGELNVNANVVENDISRVESGLHIVSGTNAYSSIRDRMSIARTQPFVLHPWSETSANLLQNMQRTDTATTKPAAKKKTSPRKKVVGMPKRPLHAYNIFFQEERQKILSELPSPPKANDDDYIISKGGGKRKRRRRATHGKISFASLAKEIGQKWHTLDRERKLHYQELAEHDLQRYDDEMEVYNKKIKVEEKNEQQVQSTTSAQSKRQSDDDEGETDTESEDAQTGNFKSDADEDLEEEEEEDDQKISTKKTRLK